MVSLPQNKGMRSHPRLRRFVGWILRVIAVLVLLGIGYFALAFGLSRVACNREFVNAVDGTEIWVISNGVHIDLMVPIETEAWNWMNHVSREDIVAKHDPWKYLLIGWGNREFYLETPTWSDINVARVGAAFAGMGTTVVHVAYREYAPQESDSVRRLCLTSEQYRRLCQKLSESFARDALGHVRPIAEAHYSFADAFYEGRGAYNIFQTCNAWAGDALRDAGVRVGYWTPMSEGVFACLPEH